MRNKNAKKTDLFEYFEQFMRYVEILTEYF